jgi:hypothetical protein
LRTVAVALMVLVLAGCSLFGSTAGQTPPPANASPQVGVAYRVTLYCALPVELGSTWWQFDKGAPWPPALTRDQGTSPYPVPGLITVSSSTSAVFRADVDGSSLRLTKLGAKPPLAGCI